MPLNIEAITEIQLSAEYLTKKRIREAQEQKEYKENLADNIAKARTRTVATPVVEETEVKSTKAESKKGE